jgi:hypothetical protein
MQTMPATLEPDRLHVKLDPQGDPLREYVTTREHMFEHGPVHIVVPQGYRTDLTSRLRGLRVVLLWAFLAGFWWPFLHAAALAVGVGVLFLRDPSGRGQIAALFHDRAYQMGHPKRLADAVFSDVMAEANVHPVRHWCNYWGVVLGGGRAYWNHRKRERQQQQIKKRLGL